MLDAAVEQYSRAFRQRSAALADRGELTAVTLVISATRYAEADDLLPHRVPR